MARAYSYICFSRPEQMRSDSLRRQREAADKWAAERGLVIDESLTDLGVSAYRGLNRVQGALGHREPLDAGTLRKKMAMRVKYGKFFEQGPDDTIVRKASQA